MAKTITNLNDLVRYAAGSYLSDNISTFKSTVPGPQGLTGPRGPKGDSIRGEDLTLKQIVHEGDGVFTWHFSDESTYTTPSLSGPPGIKGDRGISVHHMKGTSTTDPHGDFGSFGEKDTYTFYGDANETFVLGWFTVANGVSSQEDFESLGTMLRKNYDTNDSGVVDDSEALGGKSLELVEQERNDLLDLKLDKAGGTVENDLTIQGNLYVNGTETIVNTETLVVKDNEIVINADEPGSGVTKGSAGIRVDRGSEPDYLFQFDETSDSFKIGEEAGLQKVATREDAPLDTGVAVWDSSSSRFNTSKDLSIDSLSTTGLVNDRDMLADGIKLDDIEEKATADQTAEEIEALYESNPDTNKYTDSEKQSVDVTTTLDTIATTLPSAVNEVHGELDSHLGQDTDAHAASAISYVNTASGIAATEVQGAFDEIEARVVSADTHRTSDGSDHTFIDQDVTTSASPTFANVNTTGLVDGRDVSVDGAKLDTVEENAKDDQVASEVPVTSVGNLVSTDVQSALEELQLDVDTINSDLGTKVDKIVGQGLSDTNYTQPEKDKLAGLESSRFKGQFVSLTALQVAFPAGSVGDYANVDEGVGHDVVRYVWDTSDSAWIQQLGKSSQLTAAQIKQEYESNPDTNVFSDVEKQKLSTIDTLTATVGDVQSALLGLQGDLDSLLVVTEW